ncbi:antimicrobial ginkbilobin-2-like protein [Curcuma longa]|uniref:antimicrobial ginkbilobin-2-like protein n=1 Tax=Curcuma longa TaxID=136217 RepID=UPI003D9E2A82
MAPSASSALRLLVCFAVVLLAVAGDDQPLYSVCSTSGNYTANGAFDKNLRKLTSLLAAVAPTAAGFAVSSLGSGVGAYVSGLALCRGDVSSSDCGACLATAGTQARELCPRSRQAVLWFDHCMLKYSDADFFGRVDLDHQIYMYNVNNVSSDPARFDAEVAELLGKLRAEAAASSLYFAAGISQTGADRELYGLAQCTRDLTREDCDLCLGAVIGQLPSCCAGKRGGRVLSGSCNFRYELYPFLNV